MDITREFSIVLKEDTDWNMHKLHFHDHFEFMLMLSEGGELFLGKNICPLSQNTLFIINSSVLHRTVPTAKSQYFRRYILHISPLLIKDLSSSKTNFESIFSSLHHGVVLTEEQTQNITSLFDKMSNLSKNNNFGDDIRFKILLLEFMLEASMAVNDRPTTVEITNSDYYRILPVLEYIQNHYTEQLTLDDLSHHFSINKYHLCHMFKNVTSFSIFEYIIQKRIMRARELLRSPISVQAAGELVGFQSNSYFIRTFGKYTGMSPRQYAMQYIQSDKNTPLGLKNQEPKNNTDSSFK